MNLLHGQVTEGLHDFKLTGSETCRHFSYQLLSTKLEHNLYEIKITMSAEEAAIPSELTLSWTHPSIDIQNYWDPSSGRNKGLGGDLSPPLSSKATSRMIIFIEGAALRKRIDSWKAMPVAPE